MKFVLGQGIKDIVCWPRPACPPVFRLQSKWALEYGMPSTHAMVGVSIPFSVILYTMNRYQVIVKMSIQYCSILNFVSFFNVCIFGCLILCMYLSCTLHLKLYKCWSYNMCSNLQKIVLKISKFHHKPPDFSLPVEWFFLESK